MLRRQVGNLKRRGGCVDLPAAYNRGQIQRAGNSRTTTSEPWPRQMNRRLPIWQRRHESRGYRCPQTRPASASTIRTRARRSGLFLVALALTAGAQEVRIDRGKCGEPVHVVAHEAALSKILEGLSKSLGFELVYQSQSDPLISVDDRGSAAELLPTLARDVNFSMELSVDARCAKGHRVSKLSVLPDAAAMRPARMPPAARATAPPYQSSGANRKQPPAAMGIRGTDAVH